MKQCPIDFFKLKRGWILLCQKLAHTWPLKNDTNNLKGQEYKIVQKYLRLCRFCGIFGQSYIPDTLAVLAVCKNFVLMSPYPTPDITVQLQNVEWKTEKTSLAVL